jgi:sigma-B regulation protein RsbQ
MSVLSRNNVNLSGKGSKALIFSHGFGCDQHMWRLVAPAFQDQYQVVLFDHVGAGRSEASAYSQAKYGTLEGYATDVLEMCHELSLEKAVFVGHSVSAMIGVLAAIREPERFAKQIMVGPSPCYLNEGAYRGGFSYEDIMGLLDSLESNYLGWSSQMAPIIMGNADQPELGEELNNSFCRTNPDIAQHFARVTFLSDNRSDLPKFHVPSLILQCQQDAIAPLEVGTYLHQQLKGSNLTVLKATGHCPHLSAPEETIASMKAFLQAF